MVCVLKGSICGLMVTGHSEISSNPVCDCISYSTNTLGKGMNPTIIPSVMDK